MLLETINKKHILHFLQIVALILISIEANISNSAKFSIF